MNLSGILAGAATFLIIGLSHPLVIKLEYYYGKRGWVLLAVLGVISAVVSLLLSNIIASTVFGAVAFSFFWGVKEMFDQEKRVLRGWFPENPKRHAYYEERRKELASKASSPKKGR